MSAATAVMPGQQSLDFCHAPQPGELSSAPPAVAVSVAEPYKILVTASRSWHDPLRMWKWLDRQYYHAVDAGHRLVVVIHGDADGGDQIGKLWGQVTNGAHEEGYPANWSGPCQQRCQIGHRRKTRNGEWFCPAAGMYRNEFMVDTVRPNIVGAFIHQFSSGASGCASYAESMGVKVERFRE